MTDVNICISCDDNYSKYAGVVIASVLANSKSDENLNIYILDGGISDIKKQQILSLKSIKDCNINFVQINENDFEDYKKVCTHKYLTVAACYRLKLASLLPDVDKVIYFDCDVIVNSDLTNLFNIDIEHYAIAGVRDINKKMLKRNPNYINSGMLLLNLDKWRKDNIEQKLLEFTKANIDNIKTGDQEIINRCLSDYIKIVDDKWNVQSSNFTNRSSYTSEPKIIHFVSKNKPWGLKSFSYHKNLYFKYLQLTPWKLDDKELKQALKSTALSYFKYRPFFLLRPRFYQAVYKTYFETKLKKISNFLNINLKQLFSVSIFDNHLVIYFFFLAIKKKQKIIEKNIELKDFGLNKKTRKEKIILSLTSFPDRIEKIEKTVKTLLSQTLKPDKVVLYLAYSQFQNKENDLPTSLLNLKNFGLDIRWCEDLKSYKKLIPALKDFSNDIIITFDDDIYYDNDIVEKLYNLHLKYPSSIIANRSLRLKLTGKQKIKALPTPYTYWGRYKEPSYKNSLIGCGGVLYPPNSLNNEVFNKEQFRKLIPTQDDVWFWAMAVLNKTKIKVGQSFKLNLINVENTQHCGLCKINKNKKDGISDRKAFNLLAQEYPEILNILKKEES